MNMPQFQPLYKPDTKGNACVWSIAVNDDSYTISHGKVGGKIQNKTTICAPKNVGRSNESTGSEQALKEAEAKWVERKDRKGYGLTVEEATDCHKPMLAMDYHKAGHRISYPCLVQPKLDGVRAFLKKVSATEVTITSRTGKEFPADLSHIEQWAIGNMEVGLILDGELYIHGKELEDIVSAVKKTKPSTADVQFWIFDYVHPTDGSLERLRWLHENIADKQSSYNQIVLVGARDVESRKELRVLHQGYVEDGYEGIMLRNYNGAYKPGKRSPNLQKYKTFLDEEFEILGVLEDKDGNPVFQLAGDQGNLFTCVLKGDQYINRTKYLYHSSKVDVIGKFMTVKFQKKYRDSGLPQFPTGVAIRDYE